MLASHCSDGWTTSPEHVDGLTGIRTWCYATGMTKYFYIHNIRIFDYSEFVLPLCDAIRANAEAMAEEHGLEIESIRKHKAFRKEYRIGEILQTRGDHPGLVHIFSAMETCTAYYPWHDKQAHKTFLKARTGKCLHYYFYFIDEHLGLCYLRAPTWCPFRLQFYFNGHNWLANQLRKQGIGLRQVDNAFFTIDEFDTANDLAAQQDIKALHAKLDQFAQQSCPVIAAHELENSWSIMQAEYATDLIFKDQGTLQAFYPHLLETLIQAAKPVDVATFLGRKLHGNYQGEMGNRFNVRWLGRRIKHQMGPVSIKKYDKFNIVLRIETTVTDVAFFRQYRQVHHRDGTTSTKWTSMKKTIYSLPALQENLLAAKQRYLKFISQVLGAAEK